MWLRRPEGRDDTIVCGRQGGSRDLDSAARCPCPEVRTSCRRPSSFYSTRKKYKVRFAVENTFFLWSYRESCRAPGRVDSQVTPTSLAVGVLCGLRLWGRAGTARSRSPLASTLA